MGTRGTDIHYLLLNVPLTDPTAPYHSLSYLVGATVAAGFQHYTCLDTNIEALRFLAQPEQVEHLLADCRSQLADLERKERLTRGDQLLYRYALKAVGFAPDTVQRAVAVMTNPDQFYDYGRYRTAVAVLRRWLDVLSVQGFPGQFDDFSLRISPFGNLSSVRDLTNSAFIDRLARPLAPYFEGPFTDLLWRSRPDLVGLSVTYIQQLPFALYLTRLIRRVLPDCVLCVGGTEVTDELKYLRHPTDIWRLFPDCDAIVAGEGETAFVQILDAVSQGFPIPDDRPGILKRGAPMADDTRPAVNVESLATMPAPIYDLWDLHQYWAPEPVLLWAPTRGCYWNKCTFCDYGLNADLPTSPSRNRPIREAIDELRNLTRFARTVYFSVDAIAPAHLRRLAQAIVENGINVRWSAELRLERTFLRDMAQDLKDSGCVAISFGYESGSQRVLDLIDKGVRLPDVPLLLRELARVGIGAQMMGFIGFPGESPDEAYATFDFLREQRDYWTLAGIGDFVLTAGAMVAKRPADFGIQALRSLDGDDIERVLCWVDTDGRVHAPGDSRTPAINTIATEITPKLDDRPFVGGIDSAHTILYFARYGPSLVPSADQITRSEPLVPTATYQTRLAGVEAFVRRTDLEAQHRAHLAMGRAMHFEDVQRWLAETPAVSDGGSDAGGGALQILPDGRFVALTAEQSAFEQTASPAYQLAKALLLEGRW